MIVPMKLNCLRFPSRTSDQKAHGKQPHVAEAYHLCKHQSVQRVLLRRSHSAIPH
ncbi:hypothetical protein BT93_F0931 [Corymbia citriodora subsp. variegata]|nr:hypothetical protein BT93_F0931 [Corymbia citriodora subsp. variegata]